MPQGPGTYGKQVGRPPAKKRSGFKMKGSPFLKDIQRSSTASSKLLFAL